KPGVVPGFFMEKYKMFTDRVKFKLVAGKGGNGVR
ncbi:hypothetical protein SCG7109_BU_00050, partial [Chlamydiales bacterium SCGC AG-110-M15]